MEVEFLPIISSAEIDRRIPKGLNNSRIWDSFVDWFDGKQVKFLNLDENKSSNFKSLSPEIKEILIDLMGDNKEKDHFGIYLDY